MRSTSTRLRVGGAFAATSLALLVGLGGTAFAESGRGDEHGSARAPGAPGPAKLDSSAEQTEDNDANDGGTPNNVIDEGNEHPSGNDRSVENGSSGNQGSAASEPDGNMTGPERDAGGIDQPNNPGGRDLADQDGNNGCGNDDDFEDDNEGLCGKPMAATAPPTQPTAPPTSPAPAVVAATVSPTVVLGTQLQNGVPIAPAEVLGVALERANVVTPSAIANPVATPSVLGATAVRGADLARTGLGLSALVVLACSLLVAGFAMTRRPKVAHIAA